MSLSNTCNLLGRAPKIAAGSSGFIGGSIAATQVAYGSAANTIKGDAAYTFTEGTGVLKIGVTGSSANSSSITGASTGALSLAAAGTNQSITLTPSGTSPVVITPGGGGSTAGIIRFSSPQQVDFLVASNSTSVTNNSQGKTLIAWPNSGNTLLGGLTTDGVGVLQLPAATTSAGGITFGGTLQVYEKDNTSLYINSTAGGPLLTLLNAGIPAVILGALGSQPIFEGLVGGQDFLIQSAAAAGVLLKTNGGTTALALDSSQNQQNAGTINHAGQKVVSTQYDTINTTLATVTGLSVTVVAGKTYTFRARLHVTADAVGGLKYTVAGTATATSVVWQQIAYNAATGAVVGSSRTAALGTTSNFITTTSDYITIDGSIVVNAGGTLVIQAAQQAANGTSSVLINSSLVVWGG